MFLLFRVICIFFQIIEHRISYILQRSILSNFYNFFYFFFYCGPIPINWDWTAVKEKIKEIIKITQDTSLQNIRDAVLDYLKKYANNPKQQEHSFIQRIFIWLFKK